MESSFAYVDEGTLQVELSVGEINLEMTKGLVKCVVVVRELRAAVTKSTLLPSYLP